MADEQTLSRPVKRLADEPTVATVNDVDIAFAELSWLDTKLATVTKLQNAELDAIRKKYARHFQVDSHATAPEGATAPQTLLQRREQLVSAVVSFAKEHKSDLVTETLKTHTLALGTIAFRECPLSLMPADGHGLEAHAKRLEDALTGLLDTYQLPQAVERALNKPAGETGRKLREFVRCQWNWDAAGIVKLAKDKLVSNDKLQPLGLMVARADERIEVKLKA